MSKGWPKGKPKSEETKQKMSKVRKGRIQSEEWIKKRVEKNTGQTRTEEEKRKISEGEILGKKKNKKTEQLTFIDENGNEQTLDQNKETLGIL